MRIVTLALVAILGSAPFAQAQAQTRPETQHPQQSRLRLQEYVSDTVSFNVVSTLIVGPTEVMLVDAQMTKHDGERLAEMIAATGRMLTSIFITHPNEDHAFGLQTVLARFPDTPVYMTAAAAEDFARNAERFTKTLQRFLKEDAPDGAVTPQVLPSRRLSVDGEAVEIIADLQGDVWTPVNSFVYIPSLGAVIAGDIVFSGVHPFLAHSTPATREAWQASLDAVAEKSPRVVVPGHKPSVDHPDSPDAIQFMARYLRDFDDTRARVADVDQLVAAMQEQYPQLQMPLLLQWSAQQAFAPEQPRK